MDTLLKKFSKHVKDETHRLREVLKGLKGQGIRELYLKKNSFLKKKFRRPSYNDVMRWTKTKEIFSTEELKSITKFIRAKIRGIFKHGQTMKTELCNMRIVANTKRNKLTICIAKNTLNAKNQWEQRLINSLKKEFPTKELKDLILIISSKKEDLDGNATHCKNIKEARSEFVKGKYRIIFVCSNSRRIEDLMELLDVYDTQDEKFILPVDIIHDEAHNETEGLPPNRVGFENILMNPYVISYLPVTASYLPLIDEESELWKKESLDYYAINYTLESNVISTSPEYSSISDANQFSLESLSKKSYFKDFGINEFDKDTFNEAENPKHYNKKEYEDWTEEMIEADKERRRQLEFCVFLNGEYEAYNYALNVLSNLPVSYKEDDSNIEEMLILPDRFNLHIVTTPCRVAFTISLMKFAITQFYNPICIGIYRSGIHIRYKNSLGQIISKKYSEFDEACSDEELNNKISSVIDTLKQKGENVTRPLLVMGNIKSTGESITFVHTDYGISRSVIKLPSIQDTPENNYQTLLRGCYMDKKFKEKNPAFVHPPKWIIAPQECIDDALTYEKENDKRVMNMMANQSSSNEPLLPPEVKLSEAVDDNSNKSIPVKLVIEDLDDECIPILNELFEKEHRTEEERNQILELLKLMEQAGNLSKTDHTEKFNFDTFKLVKVRTYKKEYIASNYRFKSYKNHHETKLPFINDATSIKAGQCELLVAFHKYEHDGCVNNKTVMWLSYRF